MNLRTPTLSGLICLIATACSNPDAGQPKSLMDASRHELAEALNERDSLLVLVSDIISETNKIKHLENILTTSGPSMKEKGNDRSGILRDIAAIQDSLRNRRIRLRNLEARLKKSGFFNLELQKTIDAISSEMDFQTNEIERLQTLLSQANSRIGQLNTTVQSLNGSMLSTRQELQESQEATSILKGELAFSKISTAIMAGELNACYYAIGSKAELKEHKILETGFLKKNKLLEADFDRAFFTKSDKRTLKTINLKSQKVKILTKHPDNSFEITEQDGNKTIKITNPESFWSTSNYLVIQTN